MQPMAHMTGLAMNIQPGTTETKFGTATAPADMRIVNLFGHCHAHTVRFSTWKVDAATHPLWRKAEKPFIRSGGKRKSRSSAFLCGLRPMKVGRATDRVVVGFERWLTYAGEWALHDAVLPQGEAHAGLHDRAETLHGRIDEVAARFSGDPAVTAWVCRARRS